MDLRTTSRGYMVRDLTLKLEEIGVLDELG